MAVIIAIVQSELGYMSMSFSYALTWSSPPDNRVTIVILVTDNEEGISLSCWCGLLFRSELCVHR